MNLLRGFSFTLLSHCAIAMQAVKPEALGLFNNGTISLDPILSQRVKKLRRFSEKGDETFCLY
jgi:hypothetical protein